MARGEEVRNDDWFRPAPPPAVAPKAKPNRGLGQMTAVAILAAALASGGTYAATRYATPAPSSSPVATTQSNGSSSPQVIQGSASAPDWTATAKAVAPSVVSITVTSGQTGGQGSGVVIDNQGHILTNNHVATGAGANATISVTLNDGRTYDAKIVGTDPSTDLAVLLLNNPPSDLVPMSIGDSSQVVVGQPVMAIGNPLGLSGTVTTGIVSALDRPVTTQASGNQGQNRLGSQQRTSDLVVTNAIQTSAAINPGNSGGALVTADGKLIGINSSIASLGASAGSQSGNIGIGFAIPVNEAKSIADQLIASGTAQHAYIGVSAGDTTVTDGNSKRQAALVQSVSQGTPAAQAGLQAKDAVIAIDGKPIDSSEALVANIHEHKVGDTVTITVIRGSQKQDLKVTLAARPG
jgi:putative serine protease PepD